jgi:hypothetical protein
MPIQSRLTRSLHNYIPHCPRNVRRLHRPCTKTLHRTFYFSNILPRYEIRYAPIIETDEVVLRKWVVVLVGLGVALGGAAVMAGES